MLTICLFLFLFAGCLCTIVVFLYHIESSSVVLYSSLHFDPIAIIKLTCLIYPGHRKLFILRMFYYMQCSAMQCLVCIRSSMVYSSYQLARLFRCCRNPITNPSLVLNMIPAGTDQSFDFQLQESLEIVAQFEFARRGKE